MARTLRMITRRDLRERKGIPYSRQHIARLIDEGKFPPPDGKTADSPNAPNFWWETTIDVVRTLERLGLNVEGVKPVGRPPGSVGWTGT